MSYRKLSMKKVICTKKTSHIDQFKIALSTLVGNARQVRVTFLAVLADDAAVVVLVLTQESLRVVVAVDVDLRERIVCRRLKTHRET